MTYRIDRLLCETPRHLVRLAAIASILLLPGLAFAEPCEVVENPPGTITLPPADCGYLSPSDVHMILEDLPPLRKPSLERTPGVVRIEGLTTESRLQLLANWKRLRANLGEVRLNAAICLDILDRLLEAKQ